MTSKPIRPVTRRFPVSKDILENSSLPFSCVLTPLDDIPTDPPPLTGILKCLHCGAPHPTSSTHFSRESYDFLVCYLCGKTSSTFVEEQQTARQGQEGHLIDSALKRHARTVSSQTFALPLRLSMQEPVYSIPAMACPLLWFIILDGSCKARSYWNNASTVLQKLIEEAPAHVHFSLIIAGSSIRVYQLKSPVPHVLFYNDSVTVPLLDSLTPADATHKPHILSAARSLVDILPDETANFSLTLEVIVDALEQIQPVGHRQRTSEIVYAGGKVTCLWASPVIRASTSSTYRTRSRKPIPPGMRFPADPVLSSTPSLTPDILNSHYTDAAGIENKYNLLGQRFAAAAVVVDVLLCVEHCHDFGLAIFWPLVTRSGSPGPVLVIEDEWLSVIQSRSPWYPNTVYGAELRLRISPGFTVDPKPIDPLPIDGPQLAVLYQSGGLSGPGTEVSESSMLWRLGACDQHTSLTIDIAMEQVRTLAYVQELGEVTIQPNIQTCFAYTTIVEKEEDQHCVVRQMRIADLAVPFAKTVEDLYDAIDPEALAVILFHKLALASLQDGISSIRGISQEWLQSLLLCVYRSAEDQEITQLDQQSKGIDLTNPNFFENERLLNRNGDLSADDVLLAQGHERMRTIPLMVYLLMQSDAFRCSRGIFEPSFDERMESILRMGSMVPSTLTRCIAPRLQLWASSDKNDGPIADIIELRSEAVQLALMDCDGSDGPILFVDSPDRVLVLDARYVNKSAVSKKEAPLSVGRGLEGAIAEALCSYRLAPIAYYNLDQASASGEETFQYLLDILIEDTPCSMEDNYYQWKSNVAKGVNALIG